MALGVVKFHGMGEYHMNGIEQRVASNRHLANQLRQRLYAGSSATLRHIVDQMSDEHLIAEYLQHIDLKQKPVQKVVDNSGLRNLFERAAKSVS